MLYFILNIGKVIIFMENYDLGRMIKQRRIELKISPEVVANACGVHRATYNRWENGSTKDIKRSHIDTISKLLYIPIPVLLGLDSKDNIEEATIVIKRNQIIEQLKTIKDINKLENLKKYIEVFC